MATVCKTIKANVSEPILQGDIFKMSFRTYIRHPNLLNMLILQSLNFRILLF